jgi:integrase
MVASGLSRTKHTKFLWPSDKQGVEDFQNKFAKPQCAVEAKQFLPPPPWAKLISETRTQRRAAIEQTTNKHQTLRRLPNAAYRPREYLTEAEVERLIEAARKRGRHGGARDSAAILLAYRHGLRAAELCQLR